MSMNNVNKIRYGVITFLAVCYLFILYVSSLNYSQGFKPLFTIRKRLSWSEGVIWNVGLI